jgi:glucose/mannose transport system substrate-binding protein
MKRLFLSLFVGLFLLSGAVVSFAGGQKESTAGTNPADNKLEIFSWWTAGGEAQGLNAMYDLYKAKYPGVEIINSAVAGGAGTNAKAVLATRMQGGDPPDSFQVHAGHELIDTWVVADKMEDITFIFKDNNYLSAFPKGVLDIISSKGKIYSVPVNIHRSNVAWYNTAVYKKLGIQPPKTWDEFFASADKLVAAGIAPLGLGDKEVWPSTHLLENVLVGVLGPEAYKGLWTGATKWDGADTRKALATYARVMKYVNRDHAAMGWEDVQQMVIDGKAAMQIMGDWVDGWLLAKGITPGKEIGWMQSPGTQGTFIMLSDSFGLPKGAPHRDNAIKWLTLCASKEGQDAFNPKKGSIPSRIDGDRSLYDPYLQSAMADFKVDSIVPSVTHGAAAAEGWLTRINDIMSIFATDLDVDKAAKQFQAVADQFTKM